ncbi:hypothetical protein, partial [Mycoplasmoides pneumoniae]|uniref:hypothetical protein n=1 Tax=Mycoplasmoides pneumoniae TaxID=2104 RepID=UPI001F3A572B
IWNKKDSRNKFLVYCEKFKKATIFKVISLWLQTIFQSKIKKAFYRFLHIENSAFIKLKK